MTDQLRWGILGTGNIAGKFAGGITDALGKSRSALAAVGSRTAAGADAFAKRYSVPRSHGCYDALLADDTVDAVYVSLPNPMHFAWTIKALEAGKHVLCEKPIAVTAAEAQAMFDVAQRQGLLLVEAFLYRSHPVTAVVLDTLRSGAIGQLTLIRTSFCYATNRIDGNIRFSADLAGGALLDVGCYCTSISCLCAGSPPRHTQCMMTMHERGVDICTVGCLTFADGVMAQFVCSMAAQADNSVYLSGTEGFITIPIPWKPPQQGAEYTLCTMARPLQDQGGARGPTQQTFTVDADLPIYALAAEDFAAAALDGRPPAVSPADSVDNMQILDQLRKQGTAAGQLKY
jgi:predicted dehydrogenase